MKPYGKHRRRPYPNLKGHQNCGICYDNSKPPNKKRARQKTKKELRAEVEMLSDALLAGGAGPLTEEEKEELFKKLDKEQSKT